MTDQSLNPVTRRGRRARSSGLVALRSLVRGRRKAVAALTLTSLVGGLSEAAFLALTTQAAFALTDDRDDVSLWGQSVRLWAVLLVAAALVTVRIVLSLAAAWQSARLSSSTAAHYRLAISNAFLESTWEVQQKERTGRLQELLTTFSQRGAELLNSLTLGLTSAVSLAALIVAAVLINAVAAVVVVAAVAVLASILRPIRSRLKAQARRTAGSGMEFATSLSEISQLGMEMHVFGVQAPVSAKVEGLIHTNETSVRSLAYLRAAVPAIYTGLGYFAIIGSLAVLTALNADDISSVGAVMLIMLRSLSYGQALQTTSATVNSSLPFLEELDQELQRYRAAKVVDGREPIGRLGRLAISDVSFEYEPGSPVLRHIDLTIEPGEVIGVVGPSGSGKSTLVQLLLGLRVPSSGQLTADGRDLALLSRLEWARKVTFVPQQPRLIAASVGENIRFMREGISDDHIVEASKLANLHDDVSSFSEGYNRMVGTNGGQLSGGQQQRLVIARALVEDPDLLILDEPTSALDVRSEHLIRQTLDQLRNRMTIVIIAHRLSTLDICDRIMVIQDGELRGFDTPERLAESNDFYRDALTLSGLR